MRFIYLNTLLFENKNLDNKDKNWKFKYVPYFFTQKEK